MSSVGDDPVPPVDNDDHQVDQRMFTWNLSLRDWLSLSSFISIRWGTAVAIASTLSL
jgi:hypothetical protein